MSGFLRWLKVRTDIVSQREAVVILRVAGDPTIMNRKLGHLILLEVLRLATKQAWETRYEQEIKAARTSLDRNVCHHFAALQKGSIALASFWSLLCETFSKHNRKTVFSKHNKVCSQPCLSIVCAELFLSIICLERFRSIIEQIIF